MPVVRDSGMPEEGAWESFFNVEEILDAFDVCADIANVVDFGSGYGTFSIPAATRISGRVHAVDIEPKFMSRVLQRAGSAGVSNIIPRCRDFMEEGSGCGDSSIDLAMQFNILHCENPDALIREAFRILKPGGRLAIMHWIPDPETPRGPDMAIRPAPETCIRIAARNGFLYCDAAPLSLPPWHYGLRFRKP